MITEADIKYEFDKLKRWLIEKQLWASAVAVRDAQVIYENEIKGEREQEPNDTSTNRR